MDDVVGSGLSWRWAKAGYEWWMFSCQLLARVSKGTVGAKGAVTTHGTIEMKSDPVETVDLALTAGWHHMWAKFGRAPQGRVHELG